MSLYYNLPVYKASYQLVNLLFISTSNFSREYKYTIGQEIKTEGFYLIKNIYLANKALNKVLYIEEARGNLELIRLLVRLMQDYNQLSKGTSQGISRVAHFIRSVSENYCKDCWTLKLDIKGYFMAMDRCIMFKKIESKLKTVKNVHFDVDLILHLIKKIIFNDPTKNCRVKGKRENWAGLPKSKSLFFAGKDKGFPIGNLTS